MAIVSLEYPMKKLFLKLNCFSNYVKYALTTPSLCPSEASDSVHAWHPLPSVLGNHISWLLSFPQSLSAFQICSNFFHLSIHPSFPSPIHPPIHPSTHSSVSHPSIHHPPIPSPTHLPIRPSLLPSIPPSVHLLCFEQHKRRELLWFIAQ